MIEDLQQLLDAAQQFTIVTTLQAEFEVHSPKQVTIPSHGKSIHYRARDGKTYIVATRHIVQLVRGGTVRVS
jgi:hypothetical protein